MTNENWEAIKTSVCATATHIFSTNMMKPPKKYRILSFAFLQLCPAVF